MASISSLSVRGADRFPALPFGAEEEGVVRARLARGITDRSGKEVEPDGIFSSVRERALLR